MKVIALLALLLGCLAQGLLDGQVFTHALLGIGCGVVAVLCGLRALRNDPARRRAALILAGLGVVLCLWCIVAIPSAYRFQEKFNSQRRGLEQGRTDKQRSLLV